MFLAVSICMQDNSRCCMSVFDDMSWRDRVRPKQKVVRLSNHFILSVCLSVCVSVHSSVTSQGQWRHCTVTHR